MTAATLLAQASAMGIQLIPSGETIRIRAERGAIDPGFVAQLRAHKPELLRMLSNPAVNEGSIVDENPLGFCPCLTVWRIPAKPPRFVVSGPDDDLKTFYPGALRIAVGDPTRCRLSHEPDQG